MNTAAPPGGAGETFASRLASASPSGSDAVTASENGAPSVSSNAVPGVPTTGARSVFWMRISVVAEPARLLLAANVTG